MFNSCSILKLIFLHLYSKIVKNKDKSEEHYCQNILNFLFEIDHMNNLIPDETVAVQPHNPDPNREFKAAFQKLFI